MAIIETADIIIVNATTKYHKGAKGTDDVLFLYFPNSRTLYFCGEPIDKNWVKNMEYTTLCTFAIEDGFSRMVSVPEEASEELRAVRSKNNPKHTQYFSGRIPAGSTVDDAITLIINKIDGRRQDILNRIDTLRKLIDDSTYEIQKLTLELKGE